MHSTLFLAALALSTVAIPVAQPMESQMEIQACYRAKSRDEGPVNDPSQEPKHICEASHPYDTDSGENSENTDVHRTTLDYRRSAQPEPIFRAGGRREVNMDDKVVIESHDEANVMGQEDDGIETRAIRSQDKDRGSRPKGGRDVQKELATRATKKQGRDVEAEPTVRHGGRLLSFPGNREGQESNK